MAVLSYSEVVPKKIITFDGGIYEVVYSHVARKDMGKPSNRTKLRNLRTGKVSEVVFHQAERIEEADLEEREVKFIYRNRGEAWFCDPNNPKDRFAIKEEVIGDPVQFLKTDMLVELRKWEDELLGVNLPIKMELKVKTADPAVKGNTAQGAMKQVTLETGAIINTPMFINEGDIVRINTETGEYVERVSKS
jgi:elongation factor P